MKDAVGVANLLCALFEICKCEPFIEEFRGDDPVASHLRIEERELEAGGRDSLTLAALVKVSLAPLLVRWASTQSANPVQPPHARVIAL